MLVASPAYLAAHGPIATIQGLARHPFLHVKGLFTDGQISLVDKNDTTIQTPIAPAMSASHWRPVYEWLRAGSGIGVLQEPACADALREGALKRLLLEWRVPAFELHTLFPAIRPVPAKTRAAIALLKAQFSAPAGAAEPATLAG